MISNMLIMIFLIYTGKNEMVIASFMVAFIIQIIAQEYMTALKWLIGFILLFTLNIAINKLYEFSSFKVLLLLSMMLFLVLRMYPFLMIGIIIQKSKNLGEITTSLKQWNIHSGIVLSIVVMLRYLPGIKEDLRIVHEAMKLKGIHLSFIHPIQSIEYIMIPMLFKSLKATEEFSCAALVKGYDCGKKRSSYFEVKFTWIDISFIIGSFVLLTTCSAINYL